MVVAPAVVLVTVVASDICKVMSPVAFLTEGDEVLPVKRVKFGRLPTRFGGIGLGAFITGGVGGRTAQGQQLWQVGEGGWQDQESFQSVAILAEDRLLSKFSNFVLSLPIARCRQNPPPTTEPER